MDRMYSILTVKAVEDDKRVITGMASSPTVDRVGDIVEPLGMTFKNPLPLLLFHQSDRPVGTVKLSKPTKAGVEFEAKLPIIPEPGTLKDRVDEAWQSIKHKLIAGVSIGFRPIMDAIERIDDGGLRFLETEILELSLVTVPANADATIHTIKSIDAELRAASGREQDSVRRANPAGASASQAVKLIPKEGKEMKTIAEQISAFEATRVKKASRMEELMNASAESAQTLDVQQAEEYETLETEVKSIDVHLGRLRALEASKASTAKAVEQIETAERGSEARAGVIVKAPQKLDKGIGFARYAMVLAAAKGDIKIAQSIAENKFGSDDRLNTVLKAAVAAGTTTDADWAGNLVAHNDLTTDFIEYLRARTIIGQFGSGNIPSLRRVPFNVHIKGKSVAGTANWVGEGYAKPVTKSEYTDVYLGWAKVAAISVISEELARFSNPGAETLVRDDLADAVIEKIDTDFIDPDKAAGTGATASPASITNGITPITSSGNTADDVRDDIAALWAEADAAHLPVSGAVYIMDSRTARTLSLMQNPLGQSEYPGLTAQGGTFLGTPTIVSNYVPTDSNGSMVVLAFASEIFLADDGVVTVSASRETSILMDSAPNMNIGTPTPAQMVSMFQTNGIALRAERYINWARRRPSAVAVLGSVNWGVPVSA